MPSTNAPKYVLTAMDDSEDKDKQIAQLKAMNDEKEQVAKKAMEDKDEHEKTAKASIKAIVATLTATEGPIPVVRAKLQAEFEKEEDEAKKAIIKAALDVFDEGNGTQVNNKTQVGNQEEPATKVVEAAVANAIKPFQDKLKQPIIAKILTANVSAGASQEQIDSLNKSLTAKTLEEVETYFAENQVLIANASNQVNVQESLTANYESGIPFNGEQATPLVANSISIDDTLERVTL